MGFNEILIDELEMKW